MKTLSIASVAAGLLLGLATGLAAQESSTAVAQGATVYGATCGRCHAARSPLERTDREWVTIANHMRVRANLTGQQTRAVLAFLQATNGDPGRPSVGAAAVVDTPPAGFDGPISEDPATVARGRELLQEKACIGCHVVGSAGGAVGPSLNDVISRRGAPYVRQKIANPAFDNDTSMMPNFGLTPEQVEAITAYLASINGG